MPKSEKVTEFWADFRAEQDDIDSDEPFQVWHFGNTPEMAVELAELVKAGKKVATGSLVAVNSVKPDEAPIPHGYSVVTDSTGEPMCVIQTTEIRQIPFIDVDAKFAADEGEGDLSLEYWRTVHKAYFEREVAELGLDFDEQSLVCCERFRLLFSQ